MASTWIMVRVCLGGSSPRAGVALAAAEDAGPICRLYSDRPRLRPGPDRLATRHHAAAGGWRDPVRRTVGRRGDLHRGDATARPAVRDVARPAVRVVAAHRAAAAAVVRDARPAGHRGRVVPAGP